MMTCEQIKAGIGDWLSMKIMPRLDGKRQFVLGMAYALCAGKLDEIIAKNDTVRALGIVDAQGCVDIDALYNAAHAQMQAQGKLTLEIPLLGSFAFDSGDLRELRDCIARQEV